MRWNSHKNSIKVLKYKNVFTINYVGTERESCGCSCMILYSKISFKTPFYVSHIIFKTMYIYNICYSTYTIRSALKRKIFLNNFILETFLKRLSYMRVEQMQKRLCFFFNIAFKIVYLRKWQHVLVFIFFSFIICIIVLKFLRLTT